MAEGLLRARLAEVAPSVQVGSAGLLFDGRPAEHDTLKVMRKRGVDLSEHRAQRISAELLHDTSLILGMERRHVREVAVLDVDLWLRSFTLPEFVDLAEVVGPRRPGESLRTWVEHIGGLRDASDYTREHRDSEISDPYGRSARAYREAATIIAARIDDLVALAWATTEPGDDASTPPGGTHADRHRR
jgi:protein-tyrosine phosphatase